MKNNQKKLSNWLELFDSKIIDLAYQTSILSHNFDEEKVVNGNSVTKVFHDQEDYTTTITTKNETIVRMDCNCHYALKGNNCKHMASLVIELFDEKLKEKYANGSYEDVVFDSYDQDDLLFEEAGDQYDERLFDEEYFDEEYIDEDTFSEDFELNEEIFLEIERILDKSDAEYLKAILLHLIDNAPELVYPLYYKLMTEEDCDYKFIEQETNKIIQIFDNNINTDGSLSENGIERILEYCAQYVEQELFNFMHKKKYADVLRLTFKLIAEISELDLGETLLDERLAIGDNIFGIWLDLCNLNDKVIEEKLFIQLIQIMELKEFDYLYEIYAAKLVYVHFRTSKSHLEYKFNLALETLDEIEAEIETPYDNPLYIEWITRAYFCFKDLGYDEEIIEEFMEEYYDNRQVRDSLLVEALDRENYSIALELLQDGIILDKENPELVERYKESIKEIGKFVLNKH